jgi:Na+-translocating ferredoxin:NAD+ oxidoreductase RNF subunit RnfB
MIVTAALSLGVIGAAGAALLYGASKKFEVKEDPRLAQVLDTLPGANCGGCGYAGCGGLAAACVKGATLEGLLCPVGGTAVMAKIGEILGIADIGGVTDPTVAVVRCRGERTVRKKVNTYDGVKRCAVVSALYGGETGCSFGCLGYGDCAAACAFGAIKVNEETGIAEVDEDLCTSCGACVKACPKGIIELRRKGTKNRRVVVACSNKEKGAVCRKACGRTCIGCGTCARTCRFEAITVSDNLAYIDYTKCKLCRKCVEVCPQGAIREMNFPPRKKAEAEEAEAA